MHPPKAHMSIESLFSIGPILVKTVGFIGIHVPAGVGIHGPGVSTPIAAAVNAAVAGFIRLMHTPNGAMLRNGTQSAIFPMGPAFPITMDAGRNVSTPGAAPSGHIAGAPTHTPNPI